MIHIFRNNSIISVTIEPTFHVTATGDVHNQPIATSSHIKFHQASLNSFWVV